MTASHPSEVSRILSATDESTPVDMDALLPLVHKELRAIAAQRMGSERAGHTLQATALVNEAYLRLIGAQPMRWTSKAQFYAAASEAMRRILIEYARSKGRLKRGGSSKRLPVDVVDLAAHEDAGSIMSVDAAISRLEAQDERMGKIVRLRFYAGLSARDTALSLDIGERTVQREWVMARAWLIRDLEGR